MKVCQPSPSGDDGRAGHHERLGAEHRKQPLGEARAHHDRDRHRQEGQTRLDRRVAQDVLDEQHDEEEHAEHRRGQAQHDHVRARAVAVGEHPQRGDRFLGPGLDEHEGQRAARPPRRTTRW